MTTWEWSVIKALIRVVLGILLKSYSPHYAQDFELLHNALKRENEQT